MTPFEAFEIFTALNLHFKSKNYDFIKYNGKTSLIPATLERRRDRFRYEKLSRHKDPFRFLLANYADGDAKWVGDFMSPEAEQTYLNWLKRIEALTYHVKADLKYLYDTYGDFDLLFEVPHNQFPRLLTAYLQKKVSIDTLIILNELTDCFKYWNAKVEDSMVWPSIHLKCVKYRRFMDIDSEKYRQIIIDTFSEK